MNDELIRAFLAYLTAERGAAANTISSYESAVRKFAAWLAAPLTEVQRPVLEQYMRDSLQSGVSSRTVAHRFAVLRSFYRFLLDDEVIEHDPTRNLPVPKQWKTVPDSLSLAEVEKMVNSLGNTWLGIRDRAMLLTFFASGLRESELADLKLADIDLETGAAKVWSGKGAKDGMVPLSAPAVEALRLYLDTARPKLSRKSSYLFLSRLGDRLTRQQVYNRVRAIAQQALGRRVSPHMLRHSFATALVQGGADVRDVQALMRHSSVDTTQIYIHTDLSYLRRIYYASHPRARIAQAAD